MGSPPKPWERANGAVAAAAATTAPTLPSSAPSLPTSNTAAGGSTPAIPERPAAFGTTATATNTLANRFGATTGYGSTMGYGGYGGVSSYGGMGYGGMGGYGSMGTYGGYGSMYGSSPYGYGMGGMYNNGMPGMMGPGMGGGMGGPTLAQSLETTTAHTFGLLHSVVQTFTGVAQMLESTFMATHSSFFAMVSVVDQFQQLRDALGGVLGLFGLLRWLRSMLPGAPPPPPSFAAPSEQQKKLAKKPLIIFLLAMFGIPYLIARLIRSLPPSAAAGLPPIDPSQLVFARALYPFPASSPAELALTENEIVAITAKLINGQEVDPRTAGDGGEEWWKGRTRDGREGWFPRKWVEILAKKAE